jgi:hypothetical protein
VTGARMQAQCPALQHTRQSCHQHHGSGSEAHVQQHDSTAAVLLTQRCSCKLLLLRRVGACGRSPGRQAPGPAAAPRAAFAAPRAAQQPLRQLSSSMRSLSCDARDALTPAQHAQILGFRSIVRSMSSISSSNIRTRSPRCAAVPNSASAGAPSNSDSSSRKVKESGDGACRGTVASAGGSAWSFGPSSPARGLQRRR